MSASPPVFRPGAFCKHKGAQGVTVNGTALVCDLSTDGRLHWGSKDPTPPRAPRHRRLAAPPAASSPPAPQQTLPFVPVVTLPPTVAVEPLTERDEALLAFESQWRGSVGAKESAILEKFQMSGICYWQALLRLLDHPQAVATHPTMINRLRRLSQQRRRR